MKKSTKVSSSVEERGAGEQRAWIENIQLAVETAIRFLEMNARRRKV